MVSRADSSSSLLCVPPIAARRPLGGPGCRGRRRDDIGRRPRGKHARSSREAAGKGHPPDHHCRIVCQGRKEGRAVPRGALNARRAPRPREPAARSEHVAELQGWAALCTGIRCSRADAHSALALPEHMHRSSRSTRQSSHPSPSTASSVSPRRRARMSTCVISASSRRSEAPLTTPSSSTASRSIRTSTRPRAGRHASKKRKLDSFSSSSRHPSLMWVLLMACAGAERRTC